MPGFIVLEETGKENVNNVPLLLFAFVKIIRKKSARGESEGVGVSH